MTEPGKSKSCRRAFPAYLFPTLAAAAIVASCSFVSIPKGAQENVDGSARMATASDGPALGAKSAFLPLVVAKATSPADKVKSAVSADHGDAPWICTASGFGQKSKCRARAIKG